MSKVFVGMSGGVDSSLTASLLVDQGYQVTGVYMKNWTQNIARTPCPWADDLADAKRVAVQLGIELKVFDFETQYKDRVVKYMIDEYRAGRTPNPDVMCNQEIKFKLFLDLALNQGADLIATGHYARLLQDSGKTKLLRALDQNKDQTYFLYRVTHQALKKTLFPIGIYNKNEVRSQARLKGLYTANKKDSQGICFVGQVGIKDFLSSYVKPLEGYVIDIDSEQVIGRHDGAIFYTIGQRHGLELGGGLPYYVVGKDMDKNEVYVSTNLNNKALWNKEIILDSLHWINQPPKNGIYLIRVRHRAPLIMAKIEFLEDGRLKIEPQHPERAVSPGQSVVIYQDQETIGGGIVLYG